MKLRRRSRGSVVLLLGVALLLAGCASKPPVLPAATTPDVRLGPVVPLLAFRTTIDRTDTLVDAQGHAHVFIVAASLKEIHHVVVSPDGEVRRETVETGRSPANVSAALDSSGRLHLLLDDRHWVHDATGWRISHDTPWEAAGVETRWASFLRTEAGLVWAFLVEGQTVGARGRWDWYGFGGPGAGIIFPWHSASRKLVLVPEAAIADPSWYVLDPQDNLDAVGFMGAADDQGNLHIVYDATRRGMMAASRQPRYARISLAAPESGRTPPDEADRPRRLNAVTGQPMPLPDAERTGLYWAAASADPGSGTVLIVRPHDVSLARVRGRWGLPVRLPVAAYWMPQLAPAGNDAFHLLTANQDDVLYLIHARGVWSAPVPLGTPGVASVLGGKFSALGIASAGHRAFAIWSTETGIVGRWVEWMGSAGPTPGTANIERPGDPPAIPAELLDFAQGKAELIKPGWTKGLAAAAAAASKGKLTRSLHDGGYWEALAGTVLKDQYGDDLRWYYLGRAAEGMGWCDAAARYYRISLERTERFETRCLGPACSGFEFPAAVQARLGAVEAMRAAGECVVPPAQAR